MSYAIASALPDQARKTVGEALQETLVDLIDLSLLAKQAHWNLIGPRFRPLHLQLDEVVTTARNYTDLVAERLAAIGISPDGRSATVARETGLPQLDEGWLKDDALVGQVVELHTALIDRVRTRLPEVGEADPVSEDLLIQVLAELEKSAWMWQAENAS